MKRALIIFKNKKKLLIILGIVIVLSFYFGSKRLVSNRKDNLFLITKVIRGNINKIISGSGNIVAVDSFNVVTKKGGEIIFLPFSEGMTVSRGTLLAQLDSRDIERQIRDTKLTLENQLNNLEKLKLSRVNVENNLKKLEDQYQDLKTSNDLRKDYENNINLLNSFYAELPTIIRNIEDICFKKDFKVEAVKNNLEYYLSYFDKNYLEKSQKFEKNFDDFKNKFIQLSNQFYKLDVRKNEINFEAIRESYKFIVEFQNIIKNVSDLIRKIKEDTNLKNATHIYSDVIDNHFNSLKNYYEILNKYSQSLLAFLNQADAIEQKLKQLSIDIENINLNIKQSETEIKSLEISIEQTKNKLNDLETDLKDYKIYSPISGVINSLNFKKGDIISAGTILMTIVSSDKIAEIKLNEVDVADIKVGQKTTLTFDALPNLDVPGQVIEINPVGEVSQGVVSYIIKVALQEINKNIKIGMTVNADIITENKNNVIIVPNQAIRIDKGRKYVEIPDKRDREKLFQLINQQSKQNKESLNINLNYPPEIRFIKTGLSDGINTEVLEGLKEGEWIIVKSQKDNRMFSNNQQQGFFQKFIPQPRRFIRSPGVNR